MRRLTDASKKGSITKFIGHYATKATDFKVGKLSMAKMADLYMAEDAAAKLSYYMHLRQKGFARRAAQLEVGRRMPMYNSVGEVWKGLRSVITSYSIHYTKLYEGLTGQGG